MKIKIVLLLALCSPFLFSQNDSEKTRTKGLYLNWGYTKAVYSKSSIHLRNRTGSGRDNNYDFTVYNVTAHDRPDFKKINDVVNMTIPQFVIRLGYQLNRKWTIEMSYDHTKYVVDDYQVARVKGDIDGVPIDEMRVLDPYTFLHFEHTDGANFWMLNAVRQFNLYEPSHRFLLSWVVKPGAGVVFPRTDVTLFGHELNNNWKVAGWIAGLETGFRIQFLRHGFFELVARGSYANYVNAFVLGKGHGKASHHFYAAQLTGALGYQFGR